MKLFVCVDDTFGLLFNNRRQSQDHAVRLDMIALSEENGLWMNRYSAKQFVEPCAQMVVDECFLERAPRDAYCFVENVDITPYIDDIELLILYRWNRKYPSDTAFPMELFQGRMKKHSAEDMVGSSHERITREVYVL